MLKRGDNCKGFDTRMGAVNGLDELEAFDALGPNARQAIRDAPVKWLATAIVIQIKEAEKQYGPMDLQNPDLDRNIARGIMLQSMQLLMKDRSFEDAELGIKPLRRRREPAQIRRANYRGR